jgi:hypothetical protein
MKYANKGTVTGAVAMVMIMGLVSGCGNGLSYAGRVAYLEKMAREGVQSHALLLSEQVSPTEARCTTAYNALKDNNPPSDQPDYEGAPSTAWLDQIKLFFVQSCTTGLPKVVPGNRVTARPNVSPTSSATSARSPKSGEPTS